MKKNNTPLNEQTGKVLLGIVRDTIASELFGEKKMNSIKADLPEIYHKPHGTFVTLKISGNLRGCIGHITPQESLIDSIQTNALNAAFKDPRFPPLTGEEYKKIQIEISILTDPKPLPYSGGADLLEKIQPGTDGVIIKKGYHQATFLPQVWEELPSKERFLEHLCLKAGLKKDAWQRGDLEVLTYQVQAFEE